MAWEADRPSLDRAASSSQLPRPLSSDLSARLVQALGGNVREVRIDRLTEGTYFAVIVVDGPHGATEVDGGPGNRTGRETSTGTG